MNTERFFISNENLDKLINTLIASGTSIYAPVKDNTGNVNFDTIGSFSESSTDYIQSVFSAKKAAFPATEKLFEYKVNKAGQEVKDSPTNTPDVVLFGAHPCDAAAFDVLTKVFTWDTVDTHYVDRRNKLAIIGLSCTTGDEQCFCTSVGLAPDANRGSDIQLTVIKTGGYRADVLTEKGKAIKDQAPELFEVLNGEPETVVAVIAKQIDPEVIRQKAAAAFDLPVWEEQAMRCISCGACAYVCPTCSCYDIQDLGTTYKGTRVRCWDTCGLSQFTMHTSGHNPREKQNQRWRQRIMHKFAYQPERLDILGCVGCGRCSRACPVDMNIVEHLQKITEE